MGIVETFVAVSDAGKQFTINVYQGTTDTGTRGSPGASIPGMKEARTADGHTVNRIDANTWEVQLPLSKVVVRRKA